MDARFYVLNGQTPVPVDTIWTWLPWFIGANRTLAFTATMTGETVSTVFLSVEDTPAPDRPPLLFQTLVSGGPLDGVRMLYNTWEEAEAGHKKMVAQVRGAQAHRPGARLLDEAGDFDDKAYQPTQGSLSPALPLLRP